MVAALQFVAIVAFLIWCLVSSLCVMVDPDEDAPARLVWREHGPAGWGKWREVHSGLTAGDRRVLTQPEPVLDRAARAALLDTVRHQARLPESDAVQYAVVRLSPKSSHAALVFASDHVSVAVSPSVDPSIEAHAT